MNRIMRSRSAWLRHRVSLVMLLSCALFQGCFFINFTYSRAAVEAPLPAELFDTLQPGTSTLGNCLATAGAPLLVREGPRGGTVLAYGWSEESGWELDASYGLSDDGFLGVSVGFDNGAIDLDGVVVWFDQALVLQRIRRGALRDLLQEEDPTPAAVDGDS